jgi:hypothetical protein
MALTRREIETIRRFDHTHDGITSLQIFPQHAHLEGSIRKRLLWLTEQTYKNIALIKQLDNIIIETLDTITYTEEDTCAIDGIWGEGLVHSRREMSLITIGDSEGAEGSYNTNQLYANAVTKLLIEADYEGDVTFTLNGETEITPGMLYNVEEDEIVITITLAYADNVRPYLHSFAVMWA